MASPARPTNHLEGNLAVQPLFGQAGRENVAIQHPCRDQASDFEPRPGRHVQPQYLHRRPFGPAVVPALPPTNWKYLATVRSVKPVAE
jgi:hypothetical protein